ncbi:MAG: hypothetical protein PHH73_06110 [Candidatus Rickettsiella isopodorum]|nr:hypothetical protein [Candidatus Rickettsiella isopodorum]
MWPFGKNKYNKQSVNANSIGYTQLDITERFDDNLHLESEEWIKTTPLNLYDSNPEVSGLPSKDTHPEKVYEIAVSLSKLREQFSLLDDGVYCPVCHIANTQLKKLHTPCPECKRPLLRFGWK